MRTNKLALLLTTGMIVASTSIAGSIADATNKLLATTPEVAFNNAVARNDMRLITIPFCGGITPGFNFTSYSGSKPQENNLGIDCHSLLGDDETEALLKLESWVTTYNSLMFKRLNHAK